LGVGREKNRILNNYCVEHPRIVAQDVVTPRCDTFLIAALPPSCQGMRPLLLEAVE
jgi:hypothetical protein